MFTFKSIVERGEPLFLFTQFNDEQNRTHGVTYRFTPLGQTETPNVYAFRVSRSTRMITSGARAMHTEYCSRLYWEHVFISVKVLGNLTEHLRKAMQPLDYEYMHFLTEYEACRWASSVTRMVSDTHFDNGEYTHTYNKYSKGDA
jgi:hypothetical protein